MFERFKKGSKNVSACMGSVARTEESKQKTRLTAKVFAEDIADSMRVFGQFFDVSAKEGSFGLEHRDPGLTTRLTLSEDFMPGYTCRFVFWNESGEVAGFSTVKNDGSKEEV